MKFSIWSEEGMDKIQNKDTRYFIDVDIETLKVVRNDYGQKENLDKGRQNDSNVHRLFLTEGQYNKFIERCSL